MKKVPGFVKQQQLIQQNAIKKCIAVLVYMKYHNHLKNRKIHFIYNQ